MSAGSGLKAYGDPRLRTDMAETEVAVDAARAHTWTAIGGNGETVIGCEGAEVRRIAQAPDYPMFFDAGSLRARAEDRQPPRSALVHHLRG